MKKVRRRPVKKKAGVAVRGTPAAPPRRGRPETELTREARAIMEERGVSRQRAYVIAKTRKEEKWSDKWY